MTKKQYIKPSMKVREIKTSSMICGSGRSLGLINKGLGTDPFDHDSNGDFWAE